MTLYVPSYRGYRFDGLASTDEVGRDGLAAILHVAFRSVAREVASEHVRIVRLDDMTWPDPFIS